MSKRLHPRLKKAPHRQRTAQDAIEAIARRIATAVLLGLSVANVVWALSDWRLYDLVTYVDAARMWVETGNPYTPTPRAEDWMLYRYAPWFAALFVPLLALPGSVLYVGYSLTVTAASVLAVVPMLRQYGRPAIPVAAFLGTMLFGIGTGGNIQPVLVALLAWTLATRAGPFGVAVAASLKLTPLLFVLVYAGQRDWWKVGATLALFSLMFAPILLFDLPGRATSPGPSNSLIHVNVWLWAAVGLATVAVAAWQSNRVAPTRWLATGVAVIMTSPRLIGYDLTIFLAATPHRSRDVVLEPSATDSGEEPRPSGT